MTITVQGSQLFQLLGDWVLICPYGWQAWYSGKPEKLSVAAHDGRSLMNLDVPMARVVRVFVYA